MQRFSLSDIRNGFTTSGPQTFALAMLTGAIWYFVVPFELHIGPLIGAFVACLIGLAIYRSVPIRFAVCILLMGLASGALAGKLATLRAQTVQVPELVGPVLLEGWVLEAQPAKRGVRLVLSVHAIDGLPAAKTPKRVWLTHIAALKTEPGRFVRCWSVLRPPPAPILSDDYAFDRQAWYQGLGAVGYVQGRCRGGSVGAPATRAAQRRLEIAEQRRSLARYVEARAGKRAGGFAAALISGDRSFMPQADQDALRGSGLAHLLAISGLHMGLLGGLVYLILWRGLALVEPIALRIAVRKPAALGALIACTAYLIVSGASISTQRAFIMAVVVFGGVLLDRTALSLRSLSIAMILVLMLAPWSALTPGFQMSFAATGVLIATYEMWRRRALQTNSQRRGAVFWIKSLFVTSTVSSLATMPFAYFHFGRVAGLGIIANLAAMPVITLVSAPMAAAALILTPLGLEGLALRGFGLSLEWVLAIAENFSARRVILPIQLPPMPASSLAFFSAALIAYCVSEGFAVRVGSMLAFALIGMIAWTASSAPRLHFAPSGEVFFEAASGRVERYSVWDGDGLAPLQYADIPETSQCLEALQCHLELPSHTLERVHLGSLDMMVLSASPDHVTEIIPWTEIMAERGVTLLWREGAFIRQPQLSCGRRPWRSCRSIRISE